MRARSASALTPLRPARHTQMASFGVFSPAVYAGRIVLGDKRLEKLRGKGISYHSQAITEFCKFVGAPIKMKGNLIRKAKDNGDLLGFLV